MIFIDEHIKQSINTIKQEFSKKYGIDSNAFGKVFNFVTNETLTRYIRRRKLYNSSRDLRLKPELSISDIALEYGFSDQAAFTNAFRKEFELTPKSVRLSGRVCPDNRCYLNQSLFHSKEKNATILEKVFDDLDTNGGLIGYKAEYLAELCELSNEYDFDIDTCYAIAELAERLSIQLPTLFSACFEAYVEANTHPECLSPDVEIAVDLGISSSTELREICEFHNCEYYDLDWFSVVAFRKKIDIETYFILRQTYGLSDDYITPEVIEAFRKGKLHQKKGPLSCTS